MQELATYVLLGALAIALLAAIFTDLRSRTIGNWLTGAVAAMAPLFWWVTQLSLWPGVAIQIGLALLAFAVGLFFFAIRQMGGGDVKLIAALALWVPPGLFLELMIIMAMVGWVLTLLEGGWLVARSRSADGVPVLRLVLLGACTLVAAYFASAVLGGPKLAWPAFLAPADPTSPAMALGLAIVPAILLIAVTVASLVILRPHRNEIRVPYGLAIAAAGLWTVASGDLLSASMAVSLR